MSQTYNAAHRQRIQDEPQSALSYWGTGIACLSFLMFVFWLAGLKF
ncbi:hypothetical protein [Sediminicoccus sp. BL-A-41-H5]